MCDIGNAVVNIVANVATGGLYSVGKAVKETVTTGSLDPLLTQGFDLGMASVGNQVAVDLAGPAAGKAWNAAGAAMGAMGASGAFASTEPGTIAPAAAGGEAGASAAPDTVGSIAPAASIDTTAGTLSQAPLPGAVAPPVDSFAQAVNAGTTLSGAPVTPPTMPPDGTSLLPAAAPSAIAAPAPPIAGDFSSVPTAANNYGAQPLSSVNPALVHGGGADVATGMTSKLPTEDVNSWFTRQTPFVQAALVTQGAAITGGLASGTLSSLSASDRIELDKRINQERQNQIQYQNRNNAFAPIVQFKGAPPGPAGLLTRVRPA